MNATIPSRSFLLAAVLLAAPLFPLHASLLVYDDFSYTIPEGSTTLSVIGLDGGFGWSGAWVSSVSSTAVVAGTIRSDRDYDGSMPLGYTLPIGPNSLNVQADTAYSSTRVSRSISSGLVNLDTSGSYYLSFAFARLDSSNGLGSEGTSLLLTSGGISQVSLGVDSSEMLTMTAGGTSTTSATTSISFTGNWTTTGKYLMIAKIDVDSAGLCDISLSLFDSSEDVSAEPTTWDLVLTGVDVSGDIDGLAVSIGKYAQNVVIDNIAIGTTFADVTSIPEPAQAAALLGMLALLLAVARRRR